MMRFAMSAVAGLGLLAAACGEHTTASGPATQLASVVPLGGSANVDPSAPISIEFTHPMMAGVEKYMILHEGGVTGPLVAGSWTWTPGWTRATFAPADALRSQTHYTLHLGGGMRDANGASIGFGDHGRHMGGEWVTNRMLGGSAAMMGSGWMHGNGTYGMVFTFTTW